MAPGAARDAARHANRQPAARCSCKCCAAEISLGVIFACASRLGCGGLGECFSGAFAGSRS
eukprot:10853800-Alexandrium_andersonii.AAC.1